MKRVVLILAVAAILCVSAGQAQAKKYRHGHGGSHYGHGGSHYSHGGYHYGHGGYHRGHGGYHRGHHSSVIVRPRVVYPPVYNYRYYTPHQSFGFQYRGRGVSVGVGF